MYLLKICEIITQKNTDTLLQLRSADKTRLNETVKGVYSFLQKLAVLNNTDINTFYARYIL